MELEFKKVANRYEAEFEATDNFNLHIERTKPGFIKIFQRGTPDGEYASESSWCEHSAEPVIDKDFTMRIYPKWIKVVSRSEPIQAIVTMEGEGGGTTKGCDCEAPNLSAYAKKEDVPKKVSELENDSGFLTNSIKFFSTRKLSLGNVLEHYKDIDFSITIPTCSYINITIYDSDNRVFNKGYVEYLSPITITQKVGLGTQFIENGEVVYDSNNDSSILAENGIKYLKDVSIIIESNSESPILDESSIIESYEEISIYSAIEQKADKRDLINVQEDLKDLQVKTGILSRKKEASFESWYESEGKTKTIPVDLSSYSKSLLKIGLSLHTDFVDDERSVHIIDENGNLLGSISGITDSNPSSTLFPYEVFATCEKMAEDIYKIEISGLEQHIITYSDKPIGYVMAGVYSQASTSITPVGGTIYGNGKVLIYV